MLKTVVLVGVALLAARAGATECEASLALTGELEQLRVTFPKPKDRLVQLEKRVAADPTNPYWREAADLLRDDALDDYAGALAAERAQAPAHPDAPMYAYLVANLVRFDKPLEAIAMLQGTLAKDASFARAHLLTSRIAADMHDPHRASTELAQFIDACPEAYDGYARVGRLGDAALVARSAVALRKLLASQTNPIALENYATLWPLEFKSTPPAKHAAVRTRVAADLARLRQLVPTPSDDMLETFDAGYKSVGDAEGKKWVAAQKSTRPPDAHQLFNEYVQWMAAHPSPGKAATPEQRKAFTQSSIDAGTQWAKRWPHEDLVWSLRSQKITAATSAADVRAFVAEMLRECETCKSNAASLYIDHGIELDKALAITLDERAHNDAAIANRRAQAARVTRSYDFSTGTIAFSLARIYAAKHDVGKLRASVEALKTIDTTDGKSSDPSMKVIARYDHSFYLRARALLAGENKQFADAVAFLIECAAQLHDDDEDADAPTAPLMMAKAYWKQAGGTDEGWALMNAAKPEHKAAETESAWTPKTQALAPMALHDLKDRVWTGKDLRGRRVFAVAWATWCEPCKAELPLVQKLYEQTRNRKDVLVVSMNVDGDPGQVVPFIAEKKYSFPVLFAADYMKDLTSDGIPFSMIVDGKGTMRATRTGFGMETTWVADTLKAVDAIK